MQEREKRIKQCDLSSKQFSCVSSAISLIENSTAGPALQKLMVLTLKFDLEAHVFLTFNFLNVFFFHIDIAASV